MVDESKTVNPGPIDKSALEALGLSDDVLKNSGEESFSTAKIANDVLLKQLPVRTYYGINGGETLRG